MNQSNASIVTHPLIQHKLSIMRDVATPTAKFRQLLREISLHLAYEVCRDLETEEVKITTPLGVVEMPNWKARSCVLSLFCGLATGCRMACWILCHRHVLGMSGCIVIPRRWCLSKYYLKLPDKLDERLCVVVDPMLATGNSVAAGAKRIKDAGAKRIKFDCLLAAPEGVAAFSKQHPDVTVVTAAIDRELNDHAYIVPGLGDAGDRMYGTK